MVDINIEKDSIIMVNFKNKAEKEEVYFLIKDLLESLYG